MVGQADTGAGGRCYFSTPASRDFVMPLYFAHDPDEERRMRMMLLPMILAAGLVASPDASAQSFRCRSELVSVGDSMESVREKCGEPATRDTNCEPGPLYNGVAACISSERWTYRPGYGQFITTLVFDQDGKLYAIKYGDRQ